MANITRQYQASYGTIYVQCETPQGIVELAFDHEPTEAEIDAVLLSLVSVEIIELEAENGTVQ